MTFEPESFLGDEIKPASAVTSMYGDAMPMIAPEDRPDPKLPGGVHLGLYKVRISKIVNGNETIPAATIKTRFLAKRCVRRSRMQNRNVRYVLTSGK